MSSGRIELSELRDTAEADLAAQWIYQEWAQFESAATWKANQADLTRSLDASVSIPKFFGSRIDNTLAGIASVVPQDLPTHPELGPWLANVLVLPAWRRRGIGEALVQHVMAYVRPLSPRLYLYTYDHADFYQRMGWQVVQNDRYIGRAITIMQYPGLAGAEG